MDKSYVGSISDLYDLDMVAFGTGKAGKVIIPYLARDPKVRLHGVTNSRVTARNSGQFLDTRLPIRSLAAWIEDMPNATILVTVTDVQYLDEIEAVCEKAGVQRIAFVAPKLLEMIANISANFYAMDQINTIAENIAAAPIACNPILNFLGLANEIRDTHKGAFSEFKSCYRGKSVVVVGTGPTLSHYSQIEGLPHIGVNASFLKKGLKLDHYFIVHHVPEWCDKLKDYDFIKFFAYNTTESSDDKIPEYIIEENGGRRFFQGGSQKMIHQNIEYYPLMGFYSVIFQAIHFALYTRPKRIFLVGCDCSTKGHFNGDSQESELYTELGAIPLWLEGYESVKIFTKRHYPDMEIISINPVGLKGKFRDVYTESYLDAHPEIDRSTVEILDPAEYQKHDQKEIFDDREI